MVAAAAAAERLPPPEHCKRVGHVGTLERSLAEAQVKSTIPGNLLSVAAIVVNLAPPRSSSIQQHSAVGCRITSMCRCRCGCQCSASSSRRVVSIWIFVCFFVAVERFLFAHVCIVLFRVGWRTYYTHIHFFTRKVYTSSNR